MFVPIVESSVTHMHPSKITRKRQQRFNKSGGGQQRTQPVRLKFYLEHDNGLLIVMPIHDTSCRNVIYDAVSVEINIPKGRRSTLVSIKVPTSHARVSDIYLRQLCRELSPEIAETEFLRYFHGVYRQEAPASSSTVWEKVLTKAELFLRGLSYTGGAACFAS